MKNLSNPYIHLDGYACFGCSPGNPVGLAMCFKEDDEEIISHWTPDEKFAGFKGVLHGGIQATLHDEIASWVVFVKVKTAGYTLELNMKYLAPVYIKNSPLELRSKLLSVDGNKATMETTLYDSTGKACSQSEVIYYTVPEHIARRMFGYPGLDAFYAAD
jgi:uncharacterized protein (TIGR00369 family)